MLTAPEITVILPTRDRWRFVDRALGSALEQEGVDLEVVVVDDASVEDRYSTLAGIADIRVSHVRHAVNQGVARARNVGIARARGRWLAFLDDDDLWAPTRLRTLIDCACPDTTFVYGPSVLLDEHGRPIGVQPLADPAGLGAALRGANVLGGPSSVMVRTSVARTLGGFDESFSALADWDLWLRMAAAGRPAACPERLVGYTLHTGNMHIADPDGVIEEFDRLAAKHGGLSGQAATPLDRLTMLRWVAFDNQSYARGRKAAQLFLRSAREEREPTDVLRAVRAAVGGSRPLRRRRARAKEQTTAPAWLDRYTPDPAVTTVVADARS